MRIFFNKYWLSITGLVAGALVGYLYYYFVGCNSGTCLITSRPVNSTLYGSLMGVLLFNLFKRDIQKNTNDKSNKAYFGHKP
ncbi:MAG: hypothetical protein JSS67_00145 [Bacteroidetes bacterium]|nr:hypothetical protein [Bacteroidota bacterium]